MMSAWHATIRTGDPQADLHEVQRCEHHAAGQGMALNVHPLPEGGFHVSAYPRQQMPQACQCCGRNAPTKNVSFMWNVGVIVMRFHKTLAGHLCKRCISKTFWEYSLITFFFGWWGIISFFVSLIALPMNMVAYFGAMDLKDEWAGAGEQTGPMSAIS